MELESRKFKLIKTIISVNDEESILFLEAYLKDQQIEISSEELINRALKSENDILSANVVSQEQLEIDSKKW